jgi:hypothetical protein
MAPRRVQIVLAVEVAAPWWPANLVDDAVEPCRASRRGSQNTVRDRLQLARLRLREPQTICGELSAGRFECLNMGIVEFEQPMRNL